MKITRLHIYPFAVMAMLGCSGGSQNIAANRKMSGSNQTVWGEKTSHCTKLLELSLTKTLDFGPQIGEIHINRVEGDLTRVQLALVRQGQVQVSKWYKVGQNVDLDSAFGNNGLVVFEIQREKVVLEQAFAVTTH